MICLTLSTFAVAAKPPAHPEMHLFLSMAKQAREATIKGDLDTAREQMKSIHQMPSLGAFPASMEPHLAALRSAAEAGAKSVSPDEMGHAVSQMAAACGGCHAAINGGPAFEKLKHPPKDKGLASHMQVHEWAVTRMWESLVVADQARWEAGAKALYQETWINEEAFHENSLFARQVHDTSEAAMTVSQETERVPLYGQLLAACAGCHAQVAQKTGAQPTEE